MDIMKFRCTICPNQCCLEAQVEEDEVIDVDGNRCMRGFVYAQRHVIDASKEEG